jgi:hypothetical protein
MPTPRIKPRRENPLVRFLGASGSFLELTRHLPFASFEVGIQNMKISVVNGSSLYQKRKLAHNESGWMTALSPVCMSLHTRLDMCAPQLQLRECASFPPRPEIRTAHAHQERNAQDGAWESVLGKCVRAGAPCKRQVSKIKQTAYTLLDNITLKFNNVIVLSD